MTRYAFVRICIFFILGIIIELHFKNRLNLFLIILTVFNSLYIFLFFIKQYFLNRELLKSLFGIFALVINLCSGYVIAFLNTASNHQENLINTRDQIEFYSGIISSDVIEKENFLQARLSVKNTKSKTHWKKASGIVLIYLNKNTKLYYGDEIIIKGAPQLIQKPLNPDQFNFKDYLSNQQIYHQQFLSPRQFNIVSKGNGNYIMSKAIKARLFLETKLQALEKNSDEYAIASGIILGTKNNIENDLKQAYSSAGAMHILAVSGMQVALFYFILTFLFSPIKKIKYGKYVFLFIILIALWFYAFITGLSASVLRAIIMFSFICVGQTLKKNTNIYNILALSAFVLLIYNPFLILDVGFQLSYLAVLGIAILYKPLSNLFNIKYRVVEMAWQVTCVSLSAQIATLPLTLYYFHQFPTYSLLANLLIIPISSLVLYFGIFSLAISWIPIIYNTFAFLLKQIVWLLNTCIYITDSLPSSSITGFSFFKWEIVIIYFILAALLIFIKYKKLYFLYFSALLITTVSFSAIYKKYQQKSNEHFAVFYLKNKSLVNFIDGKQNIIVSNFALDENNKWKDNFKNYWAVEGCGIAPIDINDSKILNFKNDFYQFISWHKKLILILKKPIPNLKAIILISKPDYFIISNESIQNIEDFTFPPSTKIILDSSNGLKYCKKYLSLNKLKIHIVSLEGAFMLENQ